MDLIDERMAFQTLLEIYVEIIWGDSQEILEDHFDDGPLGIVHVRRHELGTGRILRGLKYAICAI